MEGSTKYATFFLVFSIAFTYFSYAFAFSAVDESVWDISIDKEDIIAAGIMFGEHDEVNVTYGAAREYFNITNTDLRIVWDFVVTRGDYLAVEHHRNIFDIGIGWSDVGVRDFERIYNSTMVAQWNNETQWSRFQLKNGYELLITDPLGSNVTAANITRAVFVDGMITATIVESISFDENVNLMTFVSWYANMITGANDYGLPSVFSVVIQVITALSLLSVIILAKEMVSL